MRVFRTALLIWLAAGLIAPATSAEEGDPTPLAHCTWVPAAARTIGYGDSFFATDMWLTNRGNTSAAVSVAFLTRDMDNSIAPVAMLEPVAAGATVIVEDVAGSLLEGQWQDWMGGLAVCADAPGLQVLTRTFHTDGAATYGQGIPGVGLDVAVGPGRTGLLMGLREDAAFRTNLGLLNPSDQSLTVVITVMDLQGETVAVLNRELEPYEQYQYHKVLTQLGGENPGRATAEVSSPSGPVLAYVSVIDNATNDPTYVAPVLLQQAR